MHNYRLHMDERRELRQSGRYDCGRKTVPRSIRPPGDERPRIVTSRDIFMGTAVQIRSRSATRCRRDDGQGSRPGARTADQERLQALNPTLTPSLSYTRLRAPPPLSSPSAATGELICFEEHEDLQQSNNPAISGLTRLVAQWLHRCHSRRESLSRYATMERDSLRE
jgi:hypothetical protein